MSDHRPAYDRFIAELARYPDMTNCPLAWLSLVGGCEACRPPRAHVAITAALQHPDSRRARPKDLRRRSPAPRPTHSLRRPGRRSTNTSGRSTDPPRLAAWLDREPQNRLGRDAADQVLLGGGARGHAGACGHFDVDRLK
jgi:hypothetical protein